MTALHRPQFNSTDPVEAEVFTARTRRSDMERARYRTDIIPMPATFDIRQHVQPTAVAAIRKAFTLAKTSKANWRTAQREGRMDPRSMMRATRSDQDVFRRKTGHSTTQVRCAILIDDSGSMSGRDSIIPHPLAPADKRKRVMVSRRMGAAIFAGTVATALGTIPTVTLDVYQHAASGGRMNIKWRWHRGTPVGVFNEQAQGYNGAQGGGNADGHALHAITQHLLQTIKRGERGVIMVVSDGLPSVYAPGGTGEAGQALIDAVAEARRHGIVVLGVAIDGSNQAAYFGDGLLQWTGDWSAMGKSLAKVLGSALAAR
jgi:hypothetical protein